MEDIGYYIWAICILFIGYWHLKGLKETFKDKDGRL